MVDKKLYSPVVSTNPKKKYMLYVKNKNKIYNEYI